MKVAHLFATMAHLAAFFSPLLDPVALDRDVIAIIDVDEATTLPELPDSLRKNAGQAGNAAPHEAKHAPASTRPVVLFYGRENCDSCTRGKRELPTCGVPYRIEPAPAWVESFPTLAWQTRDGRWHYLFGWPGKAEFLRSYNATLKPAPKATSARYPVRGSWWSGCRDWEHMTRGEHRGKFDKAWLRSLSWAELQSLHSDDHEGRVKWEHVVR